MLIDVKCPECRDVIPVTEAAADQKIECPACGEKFSVPGTGATAPKAPPPKPKSKSRDKDEDRDEPRGKKSSPRRSRRDDDDDDEDNDRPRRKDEHGGGGMIGLLIFGGIGLVVLAIGFGVTAWLIFSKDDKPETADNKTDARPAVPNNNATPPRNDVTPPKNKVTPPKNQPGLPIDEDPPLKPKNGKPKVDEPPPREDPVPPKRPPRVDPPPRKEVEVPGAPPPAAASPVVMLPGPVSDQVAIGGGGKFVFLHLKSERQIAVFDPGEKKIVKYIQATDDEVVLAAGLDQLFVGYPTRGKIERVPFATFETDKTMDVPSKHPLRGLAIGSSSAANPLLAACGNFPHGDEFFLIDAQKMKRFDNTVVKNPGVYPEPAMRLWASQDGRTFAVTAGGLSKPHTYQMRTTGWLVNPVAFGLSGLTADGEMLLGPGQLAGVNGQPVGEKRGDRGKGVWYFPAAQGPFFCSINERTFGQWPNEKKHAELQVHLGREQQALVIMPELPELQDFVEFFFQRTKPLDRHIFFLPQSNLVVILPAARDRIHYRTVDVKEALAKAKFDYLAVTSRPPTVKFGETFRYKPEVLCKKGPPTLRLDAAPIGMKLEGDTLVWTVPTRANQPPANVILSVTDGGGQEIFHNFEVTVFAK